MDANKDIRPYTQRSQVMSQLVGAAVQSFVGDAFSLKDHGYCVWSTLCLFFK